MRHQALERLLPDFAAGRLSPPEHQAVVAHVRDCSECSGWLDSYSLFSEALVNRGGSGADAHASSEQLARYAVDSTLLTPPELEDLTEHLRTCLPCRQELDATRKAIAAGKGARSTWLAPERISIGRLSVLTAIAATLVTAVALTLLISRTPWTADERNHELADHLYRGTEIIEAQGSITAKAVTVGRGSNVTFSAGEGVVLGEGFEVQSGATFSVEVEKAHSGRGPSSSS